MKIKRVVKLTFQEDKIDDFLSVFESSKHKIRQSKGCTHLELWRGAKNPNIFFTYSHWNSEADLNNYRHSPLFQKVWARTKILFSDKPEAWSIDLIETVEAK